MSDLINKYIMQNNKLILGKVKYHKDLVTDPVGVCGGGMFRLNHLKKEVFLFGSSYKYGIARPEDVKKAIENSDIYQGKTQRAFSYKDYIFIFQSLDGTRTKHKVEWKNS